MRWRLAVLAIASSALALAACAAALREPPPVATWASGSSGGKSVDGLLQEAEGAWARRAEPGGAEAAQRLYLDAAAADAKRVEGVLGAMRAMVFRIENEKDDALRARLATEAVQLGQWCQRRAPGRAACDYQLAIALGQQAREKTATARDALGKMVPLLRQAIAAEPALDAGGPHRVLALLLLRAPGWPLGPGDPEAGLAEARAAVQLFPDAPDNQLVLAEALRKSGEAEAARAAAARALQLASSAPAASNPEAGHWQAEARAELAR